MYKPTLLLTALLTLVSATPPACLLAALNEQPNPSDLKAVCGNLESSVAGNITDKCSGDAIKGAISAYEATCLSSAGVTVCKFWCFSLGWTFGIGRDVIFKVMVAG